MTRDGAGAVQMRLPGRRAARPVLAGLIVAAVAGPAGLAVVRADGLPVHRPVLAGGGAWLVSPAQGVVTLIDGPAQQVVGLLPVAGIRRADSVSVAQAGLSAYVVDATRGTVARVDGARYEVSAPVKFGPGGAGAVLQVLPGPDAGYVLDATRRLVSVVDPGTLQVRRQLSLAEPLGPGQAVVDGAGRLWTVDEAGLARFDRLGTVHRLAGGGAGRRLVLVGDEPALVDPAGRRVGWLDRDGHVRSWSCLDVSAAEPVEFTGSARVGRVLAVRPSSGTVVESGGSDGSCGPAAAGIGAPGDRYGTPVESAGFVLVPDWTTGQVAVRDLALAAVVARLPVSRPANRVELVAKDGLVFYNDLDGTAAGVIQLDGGRWTLGRALQKFSRGKDGTPVLHAAGNGAQARGDSGGGAAGPLAPVAPGPTPTGNPPGSRPPTAAPPAAAPPAGPAPAGPGRPAAPVDRPTPGSPAPPVLRPPRILDITWKPLTVPRERSVTFTADVTNAQNARWQWSIVDDTDHALAQSQAATRMTVRLPAGSPARLRIRLVVSNTVGASAPFIKAFATAAGVVPVISRITVDQPDPDAGTRVTFDAEGTDIGADPTRPGLVRWTWDISDVDSGARVLGPTDRAPGQFPFTVGAGTLRVHLVVTRDGSADEATLDLTVTARVDVTVAAAGAGNGRISGAGLSCPGTCTASIRTGSTITLTATPDGTSSFAGWSGPCSGVGTCTFTVTAAQTVTATFDKVDVLTQVEVTFDTTDDDKKSDSRLTIQIIDGTGRQVGSANGAFGAFAVNTTSPPIGVPLTVNPTRAQMTGATIRLHLDPSVDDTWRFNLVVDLRFTFNPGIDTGKDGNQLSTTAPDTTVGI